MAVNTIGGMTLDELQALIDRAINERLQEILKPVDGRSVQEILDSIDQHRWTPPPGTPSTLELLREDRDS